MDQQENNLYPLLFVTCGPSGSGKSTLYDMLSTDPVYENFVVVSPDAIRIELCQDINDQSKNKEVWSETYKRVIKNLSEGKDVYLSSTMCTQNSIQLLLDELKKSYKSKVFVNLLLFPITPTFILRHRVAKDLKKGVNRSNTLVKCPFNNKQVSVIEKQNIQYKKLYKSFSTKDIRDIFSWNKKKAVVYTSILKRDWIKHGEI